MKDRGGIDFKGNLEAIEHCKSLHVTFVTKACATIRP
jgi:hypothetical protein